MTQRTIRSIRSALILFLCALPLAQVQTAHAQTAPAPTYTDALASGWYDWSFATDHDLTSTTTPHGGTSVIAVTPHAWGVLGLHANAMDVSKFTTLTFWINGGKTGGQHLLVVLNGLKNTEKGVEIPVVHPGWQQISVTLQTAGVTDGKLSDIWMQNRTNADAATYYVDDLQLQ